MTFLTLRMRPSSSATVVRWEESEGVQMLERGLTPTVDCCGVVRFAGVCSSVPGGCIEVGHGEGGLPVGAVAKARNGASALAALTYARSECSISSGREPIMSARS